MRRIIGRRKRSRKTRKVWRRRMTHRGGWRVRVRGGGREEEGVGGGGSS